MGISSIAAPSPREKRRRRIVCLQPELPGVHRRGAQRLVSGTLNVLRVKLLSSILSWLVDDSVSSDSTPFHLSLVSFVTSLELVIPSPHLDLLSFFVKARNLTDLVNLPGGIGGWLLQELRSWDQRDGSNPATETGNGHSTLLPELRSLSFVDDRCLYGSFWISFEALLKHRSNSTCVLTHGEDEATFPDKRDQGYSWMDTLSPIESVAFRKQYLPVDKLEKIATFGVSVF